MISKNKKRFIFTSIKFFLLGCLVLGLVSILPILPFFVRDWLAFEQEKIEVTQIFSSHHPPQTSVKDIKVSTYDYPNGSSCGVEINISIQTQLSSKQIEDYYRDVISDDKKKYFMMDDVTVEDNSTAPTKNMKIRTSDMDGVLCF